MSRKVSALERALSVKLLKRTTRRLSLTDAGAVYLEHCRRVVQEAEYAERRLTQSQSALTGSVRVTCVQAFALRHLMPTLGEFQTKYPEIRAVQAQAPMGGRLTCLSYRRPDGSSSLHRIDALRFWYLSARRDNRGFEDGSPRHEPCVTTFRIG